VQQGETMATATVLVFVFTYLAMALGRIPGLRVDRSAIAMSAAVVLVAIGATPTDQIVKAIHFPTLLLVGGLMILSARFRAAGSYDAAAAWIAQQAGQPLRLLALTILDEIDLPLLIPFASLFVINDAFARTGIAQEAMRSIVSSGWLPDRILLLMPRTLLLSNTIGNVPAVVMLLTVWQGILRESSSAWLSSPRWPATSF
jgi:Na+/H+ antiporter NhaD/arsenite permease-like protein